MVLRKPVALGLEPVFGMTGWCCPAGIDMKYDSVPGYSVEAQSRVPHGWNRETQVQIIKAQVEALPEGGTLLSWCRHKTPFRCPPGPL